MRTHRWWLSWWILPLMLAPALAARPETADPMAVAFGTLPSLWGTRLSPDGSKLVFLSMHSQDRPIAGVIDLQTGKPKLVLASEEDRFELSWCSWANAERLLCGYYAIHKHRGRMTPVTRLVAVNADGSKMKALMQRQLRGQWTQFQDEIVDWLPDDPEHVLVEQPEKSGSGVSRLDIYSGQLSRAERVRPHVIEWMTDGRGQPRLRFYLRDPWARWQYRLAGDDKWHLLHERKHSDIDTQYLPVGFGEDRNRLLVLKPHDGRLALWSENLARERQNELVFSHPEVDVGGTYRLGKYHRLVAAAYSTDRNRLHFFDLEVERILQRLSSLDLDGVPQVVDESWDRRFYLVRTHSDQNPGTLYRFEPGKNHIARIGGQYPKLEGLTLAPMKPIHYEARDGAEIPAYLTKPNSSGPMPAVILPHGGPHSRDYWGYDWLTQFFSARGYAVLQANYRGSSGFGEEWSGKGGFRSWRRAIDDVTDGAKHLVASGIADPNRMCIVGWSYGGYAALLSAVEEPALYRCVVSIAGVSDLPMLVDHSRQFRGWKGMREFVGRNSQVRERGSPARRAEEFQTPVLLFHGDEDINARIEQSEKMAKELRKQKKSVEFIEYEEVEHQIHRNRLRIDMLDRIGAFLDEHTAPSRAANTAP